MIKAKNNKVKLKGSFIEIEHDFVRICHSLKKLLDERGWSEEEAKKLIKELVGIAIDPAPTITEIAQEIYDFHNEQFGEGEKDKNE